MDRIRHALVMAAGRGARMRPLTDQIPKAMAPFNGSTLIANGIRELKPFFSNIHVTVGYKGAILAEHTIGLSVSSVFNTNGKGNSFWIYKTLMSRLDEPVLVLTADNVTQIDIDFISNEYHELGKPACMVVPVKPVQGLEGDFIHHDNQVVKYISRKEVAESYCSGIQVLNPRNINEITSPVEDFRKVWSQLIEKKQLTCSKIYPKNWFTIDTLGQLVLANNQEQSD